jgi:hypothetical protein
MNLDGLTMKLSLKGTQYYENESGEVVSKVCTKCCEVKILSEYTNSKKGIGGKATNCKTCKAKCREEVKVRDAETHRNWYRNNKERAKEAALKWREENKDRDKKNMQKWRDENRGRYAEANSIWQQNNKDKVSLINQRRRARKALLPDDFTMEQMANTMAHFGGCALTCSDDINWDHVIPLATGHGGTTFGNMIPLCARLNKSKSDANIFEWF